jgi:hypothetical protein
MPCDCTSCDVLEHHTDPQLRRLTCLLSLSIGQLCHAIALVVIQGVFTHSYLDESFMTKLSLSL